jgi:cation:H+ antiporter
MTSLLWLLIGLVVLLFGGELLVRYASRLAALAGVTPLVVGLTVVAFGTSSPELAVSTRAAWVGESEVALGNVVGSNIFNALGILGVSAIILPCMVGSIVIRRDIPIMVIASLAMLAVALDGSISRVDGAFFVAALVAYVVVMIRQSRREVAEVREEYERAMPKPDREHPGRSVGIAIVGILLGLALLVVGTRWFVDGAVEIALALGVSERVVGLTIVAVGTSMPELITSIVATIRGERDIVIGNVVGSNTFNILGILGISSLVAPIPAGEASLWVDMPLAIAVAVACLPLAITGGRIDRWEGGVFVGWYAVYTGYLIWISTRPEQAPSYLVASLGLCLPLILITLVVFLRSASKERLS